MGPKMSFRLCVGFNIKQQCCGHAVCAGLRPNNNPMSQIPHITIFQLLLFVIVYMLSNLTGHMSIVNSMLCAFVCNLCFVYVLVICNQTPAYKVCFKKDDRGH